MNLTVLRANFHALDDIEGRYSNTWLPPVLCLIASHLHFLLTNFYGSDFDESFGVVVLQKMSKDVFVDIEWMGVRMKTVAG